MGPIETTAKVGIEQPQSAKLAIIIQQGKVLDFIDGKTQRNETPEEYVRQEIAKSLVREYRYEKTHIKVEFTVRVGSKKPRADLVIFPAATEHKQENAIIIVECKSAKVKAEDKKDGVGQLQSYMAACPNVAYGMWTNGVEVLLSPHRQRGPSYHRGCPRHPGIRKERGR